MKFGRRSCQRGGEPLSEFLFSSRGGFQTSTYFCSRELFLRVPFAGGFEEASGLGLVFAAYGAAGICVAGGTRSRCRFIGCRSLAG